VKEETNGNRLLSLKYKDLQLRKLERKLDSKKIFWLLLLENWL
jgi:hypothetical protein